ncbi:MAG: hypothetical protein KC777_12730 [Cyanobacteria bacterium HKST-UBA02]|nr:hypothetical protein [Cyanobacteria bacterium HKST-UBA02]
MKPLIFGLILFFSVVLALPLEAEDAGLGRNLVVDSQTASEDGRPIYDLAPLDILVARHWFPPKDGKGGTIVGFRVDRSGRASGVRLVKGSDPSGRRAEWSGNELKVTGVYSLSDAAAVKAVRDTDFPRVPIGDAEIQFEFRLRSRGNHFKLEGACVRLLSGNTPPSVVFIKSDLSGLSSARKAARLAAIEKANRAALQRIP